MRARAPGKIVISGAYAVLEGAPAIVSAVDRYAIADSTRLADFIPPEVKSAGLCPAPWFDATALRDGDRKLGLGSSAAILVASLAAVHLERQGHVEDATLAEWVLPRALDAHAVVQPLGSGIDVHAACYGGTRIVSRHEERFTHHSIVLPPEIFLEIWVAPNACNTHDMLSRMREFKISRGSLYGKRISEQSNAAEQAATAAKNADAGTLIVALMAQCGALAALGRDAGLPIVTTEVVELSRMAARESAAVLPAGAGGGDIALFAGIGPPSEALRREMVARNHAALSVKLGVRGVHGLDVRC